MASPVRLHSRPSVVEYSPTGIADSARCIPPAHSSTEQSWPVYERENLTVGNRSADVAVCALWTPQAHFTARLDHSRYAVAGNLYSREGLNLLIRNVLANPCIRHLVVCGADLTATGDALVHLIKEGTGAVRDHLDPSLPAPAVEAFRTSIVLHDYRWERDPQRIRAVVGGLPVMPPFAEPQLFPREGPATETYPAEAGGQVIRAETVASAWLQAVQALMRFGQVTTTEWGPRQRELLNLALVVEAENPDRPYLPAWLPITPELIEQYARQVLEHTSDVGLSYTYAHRLRAMYGQDQLERMAQELERCPDSRRALAVLWDPREDGANAQPPCLISVQARCRDGRLHLLANLRSSDLFQAWPYSAFALLRMQAGLARRLGLRELGPLTIVAGSAHISEESWRAAGHLLQQQERELQPNARVIRDRRGSFAIRVSPPEIVVDHFGPYGERLASHRARTAAELERAIAPFISDVPHAIYLGRELARAELALQLGVPYVQDAPSRMLANRPAMGTGRSRSWQASKRGDAA